jgi:FKBP-type peptidyl-prolyl cis-trans isomerase FklB
LADTNLKTTIASLAAAMASLAAASAPTADTAPAKMTAAPAAMPPAAAAGAATPAPTAAALPELTREEATRLIGMNFGQQLLRLGITDAADLESLSRGMKEGLAGTKTTAEEQQRLAHFFYASTKAAISSNMNNAHAFLMGNSAAKDVHTTASGLEYTILAAGDATAASPTLADQVTVRYRGTLLDGTEFDSSDARGAPSTFLVGGVIKGWQEALLMMKPGAKWRLWVPPELAYGNKARRNIPGGSLLIFDVELTGVAAAAAPAPPPGSH